MAECTIYDKLRYISETKELIKTAIETQDVEVLESDTFRQYAEYITEIRKVASINGQTGDIILKTINGQDLVGEGDITIEGGSGETIDLSNYYTKEEVDGKIPDVSGFITEEDIPTIPTKTSELTNDSGFITLDDVVIPDVDLSGYATEQWVMEQIPLMYVQKIYTQNNSMSVADQDGNINTYNFATINGNNIFGNSGDITIEGGSGVEYTAGYGILIEDDAIGTDLTVMGSKEWIDTNYWNKDNSYSNTEVDALLEPKLEKVELTQAEYDALETKDENTLYVITDATSSEETSVDLSNYYTKDELKYNLTTTYNSYDGYDQIITNDGSALNVAHINGQSILGQKQSITIEGGSSSEETDPIFTTWKDRNYVTLGNGATDSGEANGIVIGYSSTGNNNSISIGQYANAYLNSIAIGKQATTTNSGDVAIGNEGGGVATDSTYRLNISNIIKGDRSDYLYIKNANDEYIKIIDTYYTKTEIDELIGGVTDKISEINEMI